MTPGERAYAWFRDRQLAAEPDTTQPLPVWNYLEPSDQAVWEDAVLAGAQEWIGKAATVRFDNGDRKPAIIESVSRDSVSVVLS